MAAYVITNLQILNAEEYAEYQARSIPVTQRYGGRFLVRGGRCQVLEGTWQPQRIIVIEFPSYEAAQDWYNSREYQAVLPLRHRHAWTEFMLVAEGAAP